MKHGLAPWTIVSMLACAMPTAALADSIGINSHVHCCPGTAYSLAIPPGSTVLTYVSGAWNNHNPTGAWFGFVAVDIPALSLLLPLGTDEQVGFASFLEAEAAAAGDQQIINNPTGTTVAALLYVSDSCPQGGYCGDNSGTVLIQASSPLPVHAASWGGVKARYR